MDNFLLHAIVTELASLLVGGRLGRVIQSGTTDLAIDFRLRDDRWLMISTDPQRLAMHLSARDPRRSLAEPRSDTAFVSLLKKYLGGARLRHVEKLGYDRVVKFDFDPANPAEAEAAFRHPLTLVISLMGRAANVMIVEQDRVIASLRERESTQYQDPVPPPEKLDPFQVSADKLDALRAKHGDDLAAAAAQNLIGFSPLYAEELRSRAQTGTPYEALQQILRELFEEPPAPRIYADPALEDIRQEIGRDEIHLTLSPIELKSLSTRGMQQVLPAPAETACGPVNFLADRYFSLLDERRGFFAQKQKLHSHLAGRLKKQRALAGNLRRELAGFGNAETQQRMGELLLANLHQAVKTPAGFEVVDFYDEAQPRIAVPALEKATPQEAAEQYFKLARKSRHGQEAIARRLPEIDRDIAELEQQLSSLDTITRAGVLNMVAEKYRLAPPPRPAQPVSSTKKTKEEKLPGVRRYRSTDGFEILVGRTDRDNDYLTFRIAKSMDLWLHVADYPGSHVVLRNPQRKPLPPRAVTEAAQLAAKFSSARTNAKVAVNYCERKFVTRMKSFAPGQVRLSSFKTILVDPGEPGERI
jgi:predicted ribosome quality control (RQC) complex YloA/Tae2 family protein